MKKTFTLLVSVILVVSTGSIFAQQQRTKTIGMEKYRHIIENYDVSRAPEGDIPIGGALLFQENFDNDGGAFPEGWTSGGSSESCKWNVDATPSFPGFYSSPYSLNYNDGETFGCGNNWGWVKSPLIDVNGGSLVVSFQFVTRTECGYSDCPWDETWVGVFGEFGEYIGEAYVSGTGTSNWTLKSFLFANSGGVEKVYVEFYFDTYDEISNGYHGPFIDNLEVRTGPEIPVSGWALGIGIALIIGVAVIRYRKLI